MRSQPLIRHTFFWFVCLKHIFPITISTPALTAAPEGAADTSSCRLPHFWNLSNLSWESQPFSHHPGAHGPLYILPSLACTLLFSSFPFPTFIFSQLQPSPLPSNFCLLFSSILSPPNLSPTTYFPLVPPSVWVVSQFFFPSAFCISAFVKIWQSHFGGGGWWWWLRGVMWDRLNSDFLWLF